jgi:Helix-turn-helix domain
VMDSAEPGPLGGLWLDRRALSLGYRLGSDAFLVLLDLAAHGVESSEGVTVAASYRDISRRVGLSKDTVGRRIRVLCRAGLLVDWPAPSGDRFEVRRYLLRLDVAGIELDSARPRL